MTVDSSCLHLLPSGGSTVSVGVVPDVVELCVCVLVCVVLQCSSHIYLALLTCTYGVFRCEETREINKHTPWAV